MFIDMYICTDVMKSFYLEKPPTHQVDSLVRTSVLSDLLERDESFKPTTETIINAMKLNHLSTFIKPVSSLTILETLGEGKYILFHMYIHFIGYSHVCMYICTYVITL